MCKNRLNWSYANKMLIVGYKPQFIVCTAVKPNLCDQSQTGFITVTSTLEWKYDFVNANDFNLKQKEKQEFECFYLFAIHRFAIHVDSGWS